MQLLTWAERPSEDPGIPTIELLPEALVPDLSRAVAYPEDPGARRELRCVQTHISHVFLTPDRVYKLRKAVDLSFLHFGTRAQRNQDCLREVALNRRLAPDVYLGVAPVLGGPDGFEIGPVGEALSDPVAGRSPEHVVVMRRLPDGCDALSMLEQGHLTAAHLDSAAVALARFHAEHGLGRPAPYAPEEWQARVRRPVMDNLRLLRQAPPAGVDPIALKRLEASAFRRLRELAPSLERRRLAGRAVDGHGDVHLQHLWFEANLCRPLLIDCLEFDDDLRRIDTASEVAFLAMDLHYRGHPGLAAHFLRSYATATDDFDLFSVVDLYVSYRAAVRAKVAALAAADPAIDEPQRRAAAESAARHLALAESSLEERRPGPLVLTCGTVGSGKSTVAATVAHDLAGVIVASDRTRKRMAGLDALERTSSGVEAGIYTPDRTEQVYAGLFERAGPALLSGRPVILDASFTSREQRSRARHFASELGVEAWLVHVACAPSTALDRLKRREEEDLDPSDAGPAFLSTSLARFEDPDEWPAARRLAIRTDEAGWRARLSAITLDAGLIPWSGGEAASRPI